MEGPGRWVLFTKMWRAGEKIWTPTYMQGSLNYIPIGEHQIEQMYGNFQFFPLQ